MRFGATTIPNVSIEELTERWRALDGMSRVETVWVPDHRFKGWIEAWTALDAMAASTQRVRIGPLVSPLTLHGAPELARAARKLDDASGHRLELGVGSGGDRQSFERWLDELAELTGDIPLTVGGAGATALRVAASHAARWNYSPERDETRDGARKRGRALNRRLDELADRPILRSALIAYPFQGENETPFDELVEAWAEAGFEELVLDYPGPFLSS